MTTNTVHNIYNDKEIWNRFKLGDEDALKVIYDNHLSTLYNYGLKFSKDHELVKDCIQDFFSK